MHGESMSNYNCSQSREHCGTPAETRGQFIADVRRPGSESD